MPAGARGRRRPRPGAPGFGDAAAGGGPPVQGGQAQSPPRRPRRAPGRRPRGHRGHRHRQRRPHRRRDPGPGPEAGPRTARRFPAGDRRRSPGGSGAFRRRAAAVAELLHLQEAVHARRSVPPPVVPGVRRREPQVARRPLRPHRPPGAAHRWAGENRHAHRVAVASRRRPPDHHHPLPQGRRAPLRRAGRLGGVAAPPARHRHRPARPGTGRAPGRRGRRRGPAGHPDQQRRPDGAALRRRVLGPGRRGERSPGPRSRRGRGLGQPGHHHVDPPRPADRRGRRGDFGIGYGVGCRVGFRRG